MYGLPLSLVALVELGLLAGCHAYVFHAPQPLQERQNSNLAPLMATAACSQWYTPQDGETCNVVAALNAINVNNLIEWNSSLAGGVCDDLIKAGSPYCVQVPAPPPPPPTTTKSSPTTTKEIPKPTVIGNGIVTPLPIQSGMIKSCNKFHFVAPSEPCSNIASKYKVSIGLLYKWNPAIGAQCTGMWAENYLCVGIIGGNPTTTAAPSNGTPSPIPPNTTKNCKKWAYIRAGDTCQAILNRNKDIKSTIKDLVRWNPSIKGDCSGLISHNYLCIVGPAAPPTTTKPGSANPTPSPLQPGTVKNCKAWAYVKENQTCQDILKRFPKLTMAKLYAWNPAIGKDCKSLWARTYVCVGV